MFSAKKDQRGTEIPIFSLHTVSVVVPFIYNCVSLFWHYLKQLFLMTEKGNGDSNFQTSIQRFRLNLETI